MTDGQRKGTRCAVCVMCGRCFEDDDAVSESQPIRWTGTRCDVCVGCGKCAEAWGLVGADDTDANTGPTNWADAFKVMDIGSAGAPPPIGAAPGESMDEGSCSVNQSNFACLKRGVDADASTGATPGVSSACKEYGFDDMEKMILDLGIKPPGMA